MKSGGKKNMSLRVKIRASFFKSNRCNSVKIVVLAWSSFFPRRCNAPLPFFFSGRRGETKEYKDKRREEKWKRKLSLGNCPFFFTSLQVVRRGGGGGGGGGGGRLRWNSLDPFLLATSVGLNKCKSLARWEMHGRSFGKRRERRK